MSTGTHNAEKYAAKKAAGVCPKCTRPRAPNRAWCWGCLKRAAENRKRRYWDEKARTKLIAVVTNLDRPCDGCGVKEAMSLSSICWCCKQGEDKAEEAPRLRAVK